MSASTKLAAFVVFARLVSTNVIDAGINGPSGRVLLTLACLTSAIFGATVALKQSNIKRAIAYSSISHTGYILLAMKSGGSLALGPVITYVIAYGFIIVGTYLVIGYLSTPNEQNDSILSINALAKTNPYIAGSLTVFLLAQAGIPLTSGFIAKFEVFRVALDSKFYITSLIVLIATVISAAFYLKLILSMYSDSFNHDTEKVIDVKANIVPKPTSIAIGVCVFITVAIGVFPSLLTGFTNVL